MTEEELKELYEERELIGKFMGYKILHKEYQYEHFNSSNESSMEWDEDDIVCDEKGCIIYDEGNEPYFDLNEIEFESSGDFLLKILNKINSIRSLKEDGYYFGFTLVYAQENKVDYESEDPYWEEIEKDYELQNHNIKKPMIYESYYHTSIIKIGLHSINKGLISKSKSEFYLQAIYETIIGFIKWYNENEN